MKPPTRIKQPRRPIFYSNRCSLVDWIAHLPPFIRNAFLAYCLVIQGSCEQEREAEPLPWRLEKYLPSMAVMVRQFQSLIEHKNSIPLHFFILLFIGGKIKVIADNLRISYGSLVDLWIFNSVTFSVYLAIHAFIYKQFILRIWVLLWDV